MAEIAVERLQRRALLQRRQQRLAHLHQRERAAGGMVEAANQLLPGRLGAGGQFAGADAVGRIEESARGLLQSFEIGAEFVAEAGEENPLLGLAEDAEAGEQDLRRRRARGFASLAQQLARQFDQPLDVERRRTAVADPGATATGHALPETGEIFKTGGGFRHRGLGQALYPLLAKLGPGVAPLRRLWRPASPPQCGTAAPAR